MNGLDGEERKHVWWYLCRRNEARNLVVIKIYCILLAWYMDPWEAAFG